MIHSNATASPKQTATSRNPGLFTLEFDSAANPPALDITAYKAAGAMINPTDVRTNGTARGTTIAGTAAGITGQHARVFEHYNNGGSLSIQPPSGTIDPLPGTDAGSWVFSFLMSTEAVIVCDTLTYGVGMKLITNRGSNNSTETMLHIAFHKSNLVLVSAEGATVLVAAYQANKAYKVDCALDMDAHNFRVTVNGAVSPTLFTPLTGASTKGIGGFIFNGNGGIGYSQQETGLHVDNIMLTTAPIQVLEMVLSDPATGSKLLTTQATANLACTLAGPAYVKYLIALGDSPVPPANNSDPRWTAGTIPASVSLGSPADGETVQASLWLLDAADGIGTASASIVYDSSAIAFDTIEAAPGACQATITWNTNVPATGRVRFDLDGAPYDNVSAFETTVDTSHTVTITGLLPAKVYHFAVESNGVVSSDGTFEHLMDVPEIADIAVTPSYYTATVTWTTAFQAVGWIEYGPAGAALTMATAITPTAVTSHSAILVGLAPCTGYDFVVHSNAAVSPLQTLTTGDPGLFTLEFSTASDWPKVDTAAYMPAGGMTYPTDVTGNGMDRGTTLTGTGAGITGQHARVFEHYNNGGSLSIQPPSGTS